MILVPAASAWASGRLLRDCADDEVLSKAYTQKEYRDALSRTDSSEYSDCESVIPAPSSSRPQGRQQEAQSGGGGTTTTVDDHGGSTGSSGGAAPPADSTPTPAPAARGTDPLAR